MPSDNHNATLLHAGLQHAVLMRAMPVLRHDLSSPLSVMRMGSMLLKRHLQRGDANIEDAVTRVEQLEQQLTEISTQIRRLRQWDFQVKERLSLKAMALEATALARPMLLVGGIEVQAVDADDAGWSDTTKAPHTLLYAFLAAIYHLAEKPGNPPQRIALKPDGTTRLIFERFGEGAVPDDLGMNAGAPHFEGLEMDAAAVTQLAASSQCGTHFTDHSVTITLQNA